MRRTARCLCGALQLTTQAPPLSSYLCHCVTCQRRTGSVVHHGAKFRIAEVTVTGASTTYTRTSDSGSSVEHHFCPTCGTTVFWRSSKYPDDYGVAVGCFADPTFPPPRRSIWEEYKHPWLGLPDAIEHRAQGFAANEMPNPAPDRPTPG
jgi:hypothetical protein